MIAHIYYKQNFILLFELIISPRAPSYRHHRARVQAVIVGAVRRRDGDFSVRATASFSARVLVHHALNLPTVRRRLHVLDGTLTRVERMHEGTIFADQTRQARHMQKRVGVVCSNWQFVSANRLLRSRFDHILLVDLAGGCAAAAPALLVEESLFIRVGETVL